MAHWTANSPSSASKTYAQRQKCLLRVQLLDIWANSVSKRNPFAGITPSPSSISLFFTFVLMWSFISLLHSFYTCSSHGYHCMSRSKLQKGKTLPEAMHILGNLASHKSYLLPLSVKAVQNPNSRWASNAPERKPKSHILLHYHPLPSVCSVTVV